MAHGKDRLPGAGMHDEPEQIGIHLETDAPVRKRSSAEALMDRVSPVRKKGKHRPLRFSKSGNEQLERAYATHYVDQKRIAQLKQEKKAKQTLNKDDADVCFPHCFFAQVSPEAAERATAEKRRKLTAN